MAITINENPATWDDILAGEVVQGDKITISKDENAEHGEIISSDEVREASLTGGIIYDISGATFSGNTATVAGGALNISSNGNEISGTLFQAAKAHERRRGVRGRAGSCAAAPLDLDVAGDQVVQGDNGLGDVVQGHVVGVAVGDVGLVANGQLSLDLIADIVVAANLSMLDVDVGVQLVELLDVVVQNIGQVGAHGVGEGDGNLAAVWCLCREKSSIYGVIASQSSIADLC